jgi:hypothetical protein
MEWIHVIDQLPNEEVVVLVAVPQGGGLYLRALGYYYNNNWWYGTRKYNGIVTHWMYLPKPPTP